MNNEQQQKNPIILEFSVHPLNSIVYSCCLNCFPSNEPILIQNVQFRLWKVKKKLKWSSSVFHFIHTINIYIKTNLPERKLGQLDNGIHQELYGKKREKQNRKKKHGEQSLYIYTVIFRKKSIHTKLIHKAMMTTHAMFHFLFHFIG